MKAAESDDLVLDRLDRALLAAVQHDASQTHQQLAEAVHVSASQVSRRLARLQSLGVLRAIVAVLDAQRLGLAVQVISYVTLGRHGEEEGAAFERAVAAFPEVLRCDAVTGECDYILHIVAPTLQALADSVLRRLTRLPAVQHIRSNVVLRNIKNTTALPL